MLQIYTHNFRETGDTPKALDGDMEYSFKRQSRYKYELEEYHYLNKKQQILKEKQLTIMRKKLRLVLLNESMLWITQYKIKITEVFLITSIIKIRASVFIPTSWTEPKKDIKTGNLIQFEGDSREFTPNAVNAMRSRIEQEVVVDFYKKKFSHMQILV